MADLEWQSLACHRPIAALIVMVAAFRRQIVNRLVILAALAAMENAICISADSPAAQRLKAEVQRKQAETKRKIEQQSREIKAARDRNSQQTLADIAKARTDLSNKPTAPPFDAAAAPPPAE